MQAVLDDRYEVYIQDDSLPHGGLDAAEHKLITCSTYEEAKQVRQSLGEQFVTCVIRYVGPAGGGD